VAAPIVGIEYSSIGCLLGAALLLGISNAFVRPILLLLSFPLILITLGLFIFIINALMLKFVSVIVPCFQVHGFWSAVFGAIIISFVSWLLSAFFRGSDGRVHVLTHHGQIKQVRGRVIEPGE
jgi:putative membrane protein